MKKNQTLLIRLILALFTMCLIATVTSCAAQRSMQTTPSGTTSIGKAQKEPIKMILDADFGSSTDDLFALMMLNHYIDDGMVDLKGVIVDREGAKNAGIVDIFNTYYGHPDIPVGLERNGVKNPRCFIPYNGICDLKDSSGNPLFKRTFDENKCPDGYKLYRQLLSRAEDKSIVVVAIGFATTLAQLFESQADEYSPMNGIDLFAKKVKSVYIQSGRFEAGDSLSGYNMRAASARSAIFYDNLPHNVDLIMSPSNVGDQIDYQPRDVLVDLSYTEVNPIKSVYTNYICDTGQRMWDTNCLVNAVLGDNQYNLSPRGWVTFVDKGEESLMTFKVDPAGNARYQMPGDSYFSQEKLMDIRRHNRINRYPSAYSIEAPQPQLITTEAVAWTKPRLQQLKDKYMGSAGNTLDPNDVRAMFRPIGYTGPNATDYSQAENILVDTIFTAMAQRAVRQGNKSLVIVTGPPACGKSTAVRELNLRKAGLIYDADLTGADQLAAVIRKAGDLGMDNVTVVMVYNDINTCFNNILNRGKTSWRYTAMDYLVQSFTGYNGKLQQIKQAFPELNIIAIDCSNNRGVTRVPVEDAMQWDYNVSDAQMNTLLTTLLTEINNGSIEASLLPSVAGNLTAIPKLNSENMELAQHINQLIDELTHEYKMR